jgi:hypothetical protein
MHIYIALDNLQTTFQIKKIERITHVRDEIYVASESSLRKTLRVNVFCTQAHL